MVKKTAHLSADGVEAIEPPADIFKSSAELNATSVNFLKIDLNTALTFTGIALEAQDAEKRDRNRHNARIGYDTVLRLLPKVSPTPDDEKIIEEKLELLKAELVKLGERF